MIARRGMLYGVLAVVLAVPGGAQAQTTWSYDHVHLAAPDTQQAMSWYVKNLGGKPSDDEGNVVPMEKATRVVFEGIMFLFQKSPSAQPSSGSVIDSLGFSYANLDAKVKELEAAGAKVTMPFRDVPGLGKQGAIDDPWGTKIELLRDPGSLGFHHIGLRVPNPEASLKFYVNAFGGSLLDGIAGLAGGNNLELNVFGNRRDHMRKALLFLLAAALFVPVAMTHVQGQGRYGKPSPNKTLEIYFIDTEGGQSNLVVTPTGDSMLLDTGSPMSTAPNAPQPQVDTAARITAVLKQAGVQTIDYMIVSHYHGDHVGNAAEMVKRIPVRHIYDRGGWSVEASPARAAAFFTWKAVRDSLPVTVPKVGEKIPITGIDAEFVTSTNDVLKTSELLKTPMRGEPGAGAPNPACKDFVPKDMDPTPENYYSLGMTIKYNNWRMLDLFDLTWNQEKELVCPNNLLGTFDLYHTTRHGTEWAGSPVLLQAARAPIVVMNNGARKGGIPETFKAIKSMPGFQDLWQEHYSEMFADANPSEQFIANMNTQDHGHNFHLTVRADGSATMVNERTNFKKEYPPKRSVPPQTAAVRP